MKTKIKGFSLLEILTVLVIISIISSLMFVSARDHRRAIGIARTRLQFLQYESAINRYFRDYGDLPAFFKDEEIVSLADGKNAEIFFKILSGHAPTGRQLSEEEKKTLNPKGKMFHKFSDSEFFKNANGMHDKTVIVDAFNNKNIFIIVEDPFDDDVIISKDKFPAAIRGRINGGGINNPVVIFSISSEDGTVISNCFD